jgi:glycopeptide antibiotics resistance protein
MKSIATLLTDILKAIYEHTLVSIVIAVLFMFFLMFVSEHGLERSLSLWVRSFRKSKAFRLNFFTAFYTVAILHRTVLGRAFYGNPLKNVIGIFSLVDKKGNLASEPIENIVLFVPFAILLLLRFPDIHKDKPLFKGTSTAFRQIFVATAYSALFSLCIEMSQIFFNLGEFQLADLVHNTSGGLLGAVIFVLIVKIHNKRSKNKRKKIKSPKS